MKKNLFLISSLVLTTFPTFGLIGCKPTKEQKFTFTDMTNSIVSIKKPKKIAIPSRAHLIWWLLLDLVIILMVCTKIV